MKSKQTCQAVPFVHCMYDCCSFVFKSSLKVNNYIPWTQTVTCLHTFKIFLLTVKKGNTCKLTAVCASFKIDCWNRTLSVCVVFTLHVYHLHA